MDVNKLHPDELDIDGALAKRLVAAQFPEMRDLPISAVRSTGTVNAIYRLGDHLYARLPRLQSWEEDLEFEGLWLPQLAPRLTLQIPEPVANGRPGEGYPCTWAIYRWIDGAPYSDQLIDDERQAAEDLARFVLQLRGFEPTTGVRAAGRQPLAELDAETREAIMASSDMIDSDAATHAWGGALEGPAWEGTPVWIHSDLLRPNLLVHGGRIRAVIDFGGAGIGDPATDVIAGWSVFGPIGRGVFRSALEVDDAMWSRAKGIALHQAALIIPYYAVTNPSFVASAKRTIEQILADS